MTASTPEPTSTNITVTVDDGDNNAVENATVVLTDTTDSEVTFTATTNSSGECTLSNVEYGEYTVTATATGYENYTALENITVTSSTSTLNISMTEVTPTTTNISVSVTDGTNAIENAVVLLTDTTDNTKTYTATSGSAGGCTLSNVEYGTYTVTATATGYEN